MINEAIPLCQQMSLDIVYNRTFAHPTKENLNRISKYLLPYRTAFRIKKMIFLHF